MMAAWWQHMLYSIIYCIQLFIVFNYLFFKLCYIASYFIIQYNIVFIQYCITMFHHIVSDHIIWDFMIFCFMILHYYIVYDIMCLEDILMSSSHSVPTTNFHNFPPVRNCLWFFCLNYFIDFFWRTFFVHDIYLGGFQRTLYAKNILMLDI